MALEKVDELMDLDRTDELFNSSIKRSGSHDTEPYGEEDIKKQRLVVGFGNLHINTAKVKLGVARMKGYLDSTKSLKKAVDRKVRNNNKYGRNTD